MYVNLIESLIGILNFKKSTDTNYREQKYLIRNFEISS